MVGNRTDQLPRVSTIEPRNDSSIPRGQWAISGVLMPPSWTQCLYSRNGVFHTFAQPSP